MPRLFVALRPSLTQRRALLAIMGGVPGARWQDEAQLHLTLSFIGDVDDALADDVALALHSVRAERPSIALRGVGTFERRGMVHTLWAGIAPDPRLTALQARIEGALRRLGLQHPARPFLPHVTLARLNRSAGPVGDFLIEHGIFGTGPEPAGAFLLYRSILNQDGAIYEAEERYPLE